MKPIIVINLVLYIGLLCMETFSWSEEPDAQRLLSFVTIVQSIILVSYMVYG